MALWSENTINENRWYKLDNAAKIYPAISSGGGNVFRVAVQLKYSINPEMLKQALATILPRFPTFAVRMHKGLFWYYFEENPKEPLIFLEEAPPCHIIRPDHTNGYLFRVSYYNKRIAVEVFHALTDGVGALTFLKALTFQYLALSGFKLTTDATVPQLGMLPSAEETEDSFKKYYNSRIRSKWKEDKAYQIMGTRLPGGHVHIVHGIVSINDFSRIARERNATITEYVAALVIYSIYSLQLRKREHPQPVKVSIPVNLRNIFPSKTLRNFSSYANVGMRFSDQEYSFEQVLDTVVSIMKQEIQPDRLKEKISANVKAEQNIFMRLVPLYIKNIVLRTAFNAFGESLFTCALSNLGIVKVPPSMGEHVERFEFLLGRPVLNMMNCTLCSYGNEMMITFTKSMHETDIERFFFGFLVEKGLEITIETN